MPLHHCNFVFSFKERVLCAIAAAPWAWKGPALPHGWGDTCLLPLCWPRPSWGRGTRRCSLSVPNTEPRVGGHLVMPQDLRLAEVGLGWAGQNPVTWAGVQPMEMFEAGTPALRAFGGNTTAKLIEPMGQATMHTDTCQAHVCAHGEPRHNSTPGTSREGCRPCTRFLWFWGTTR